VSWDEGQETTGKERVYVKFGPHQTDEMPREWAEKMLANWKERQPTQFGKYLAEVVTGTK
jgi:hypothetical protein